MDHFDQRRGADNRVDLLKPQRVEWCKRLIKETCGASQPRVSFALMVTLVFGWRLIAAMSMVSSSPRASKAWCGTTSSSCA